MTAAFNLTVRVQLTLSTIVILSSGTPPHYFQVPGSSQLPTTSLLISFKLICQRLSQYESMPTKSRPLLFIPSHSNEFVTRLYSATHLKSAWGQMECVLDFILKSQNCIVSNFENRTVSESFLDSIVLNKILIKKHFRQFSTESLSHGACTQYKCADNTL